MALLSGVTPGVGTSGYCGTASPGAAECRLVSSLLSLYSERTTGSTAPPPHPPGAAVGSSTKNLIASPGAELLLCCGAAAPGPPCVSGAPVCCGCVWWCTCTTNTWSPEGSTTGPGSDCTGVWPAAVPPLPVACCQEGVGRTAKTQVMKLWKLQPRDRQRLLGNSSSRCHSSQDTQACIMCVDRWYLQSLPLSVQCLNGFLQA